MKTSKVHIPISDAETSASWEEIKTIFNNYIDPILYGHRNNISLISIGAGSVSLSGDTLTLTEAIMLIGADGIRRYVQAGSYELKDQQFFCVDFKSGEIILTPVVKSVINNDTLHVIFYRNGSQIISQITSISSLGSDNIEFLFDNVSLFDYPNNPINSQIGKISALNMKGVDNKGISFQINKPYSRTVSLSLDVFCENINPADELQFIIRFYVSSIGGTISTLPSAELNIVKSGLTQKIERLEFADLDVGQSINNDNVIYVEIEFVNDAGEYGVDNNYHLIRGKGVFK